MKLLIASDLHGSLSATEQILNHFEQSGADWLILLGDLLNHGPRNPLPDAYQPAEVARCLNQYATRIIAVQGNCDSEVDQMLLTFPILSPWQQVLLTDRRLFLTHGHHYHPQQRPPLNWGDVLAFGHTHLPMAEEQAGCLCFNPGSASLPKGGYPASFGVLDQEQLQVLRLQNAEKMFCLNLALFPARSCEDNNVRINRKQDSGTSQST